MCLFGENIESVLRRWRSLWSIASFQHSTNEYSLPVWSSHWFPHLPGVRRLGPGFFSRLLLFWPLHSLNIIHLRPLVCDRLPQLLLPHTTRPVPLFSSDLCSDVYFSKFCATQAALHSTPANTLWPPFPFIMPLSSRKVTHTCNLCTQKAAAEGKLQFKVSLMNLLMRPRVTATKSCSEWVLFFFHKKAEPLSFAGIFCESRTVHGTQW